MNDFPIQLEIKTSDNTVETVDCYEMLREISGKRQVYQGTWNDKAVIIKLFLDPIHAARHFKRELNGMNKLQKLGINSPEPLFHGETNENHHVIVSENITESQTVFDAISSCSDDQQKIEFILKVCTELAKQHEKGVIQKDLHLGNFLIKEDKIYALDPAQMSFSKKALTKNQCLDNLGSLAMSLPNYNKENLKKLCLQYFNQRQWKFTDDDERKFEKHLLKSEQKSLRHSQKKCMRTSKRTLKLLTNDYLSVLDKSFCENINPHEFIAKVDELMDKGNILKNGNTSYISRFNYNGKDIVIKRYNYKGPYNLIKQNIQPTRAKRNWLYANMLTSVKIATPKPYGFIEKKKGPFVWQSYYISQYVDAINLYTFLANPKLTQTDKDKMAERIFDLMSRLGKRQLSHGDMKRSNILITDKELILIDLDSMRKHGIGLTCQIELAKDVKRLAKNKHKKHKGIEIDFKELMSNIQS